ncbi:inositol 2-dehydrogenase [Vagococcus sp. BWB3-3]|uniref:Inositol 2-dehydrogenase n=1 Tax=Vagococcus allomyrinae TaxID=2794353 RepID=A0A940SUV3_9ENTE|nr:inositol 2-dehydrogenase [Vagococcus allomyrinae]MBP1041204.1 inositol 2-dehydrogenase [Vagococcus allomyrinae]
MSNIRIGLVGLGRLGMTHATNIAKNIPEMDLVAICSLNQDELTTAQALLDVKETYLDYQDMLASPNLDAIVIVSPSGFHCQQIQLALEAGLHVFCEKPIGLSLAEIDQTLAVINTHPHQKFMLGFMRRFDDSYQYAKQLVDAGELGELTVIRCYGIDPSSGMESFVKFAANSNSGGIFADMAIHDIDLIRWFSQQEINRVWALGKNAAYPELDQVNELETGTAMMQLSDHSMALLVTGRNAAHGYHVETELIGTKGMLRIGAAPEKNLVTLYNEQGVVRPTSQNFPERFGQAFLTEMKAFATSIIEDLPTPISGVDGLQATKIAAACQQSFETNEIVEID